MSLLHVHVHVHEDQIMPVKEVIFEPCFVICRHWSGPRVNSWQMTGATLSHVFSCALAAQWPHT